ncbi:MAG: 3-keto-disaccharide hydrolase, partial [Bryobacteraceae bacterium]
WKQLFNGKDMDGWSFLPEGKTGFSVSEGLLHTGGAKGMLWYTREKIGNVRLRVVYKMSNNNGNSGVFVRIPTEPESERFAVHRGIEVQIDDSDDEWHTTGTLYSMTKAKARPSKAPGEWNTMEITLDGLRTIVYLNGVLVTDYDGVSDVPERTKSYEPERGQRPEYGYIGLQNHDQSAVISFKEISVAPLKQAAR